MQVHNGDDNNFIGINAIKNAVRKAFDKATACIGGDFYKSFGLGSNSFKRLVNFV